MPSVLLRNFQGPFRLGSVLVHSSLDQHFLSFQFGFARVSRIPPDGVRSSQLRLHPASRHPKISFVSIESRPGERLAAFVRPSLDSILLPNTRRCPLSVSNLDPASAWRPSFVPASFPFCFQKSEDFLRQYRISARLPLLGLSDLELRARLGRGTLLSVESSSVDRPVNGTTSIRIDNFREPFRFRKGSAR
jgi:hypothetical protein